MPESKDKHGDISAQGPDPLIGVKLGGQYTIVGVLGGGGLGTIYRGHQEMVDRQVAIKFLPSALAKDQVIVKRMAREGKALGRLNHPNIVTTYDFGFTEKREPYLVLELVGGETMQAHLERLGPMPFGQCLPIFIMLADAMKYAHANGVVHRDLKPHNIMLLEADGKTTVKILDFGIAQMESEAQKLTLAGEIWGSPHYMSPEQCSGGEVDHLTDIYSLGIVMYSALSGQLPHTGESFAEVVSQKLFEPVPSFAALDVAQPLHVPIGLEKIVFKCLRRKTVERYQSMEELKMALEAFAKQTKNLGGADAGKISAGANPAGKDLIAEGAAPKPAPYNLQKLILPAVALITVLMVVAVALLVYMALLFHPLQSKAGVTMPFAQPVQPLAPAEIEQTTRPAQENVQEQSARQQSGQEQSGQGQPARNSGPSQGSKEITQPLDLDRSPADNLVKPEVSGKQAPAEVPDKQAPAEDPPVPGETRQLHPSPTRIYRRMPGVKGEDSRSGANPSSNPNSSSNTNFNLAPLQHDRQSDPNGFYTKWGGVKDAQ